jgi:hypothetical protein
LVSGVCTRFLSGALLAGALCFAPVAPAAAFDLFARHEVTAQFATPDGKPMAGAEVRVYGPGDPNKVVETGRTDAEGKFTFPADRDGFWSAEARTAAQVARVMIRVGGVEQQQQPGGRLSPAVAILVLAGLVAIAFCYRALRRRSRSSQK